jgi:hypothetical protein
MQDLAQRGNNCLSFLMVNGEDTHLGDGFWSPFLTKGSVLSQSDFPKGTHLFYATFLFVITLKPNLAIKMG